MIVDIVMRVLLIGAGGHAWVVADILLEMRKASANLDLIGFVDDNPDLTGRHICDLPVLGTTDDLPAIAHDAVVVAIGDNQARKELFDRLNAAGETTATAVHPKAILAADLDLGHGTMITAGVVVNPGSMVGADVILNTGCTVDHHNRIGNHVHLAPGVHLGGEVEIGEGALVGIGATVLPRTKIGAWSLVGAGSLVTRDVPDGVVVVGNPARVLKHL